MDGDFNAHRSVQDYYGKLLQSSADLKTSACCVAHKPMLVCGNTADMLQASRYAPHFYVLGDHVLGEKARHFGLFDCADPTAAPAATSGSCC